MHSAQLTLRRHSTASRHQHCPPLGGPNRATSTHPAPPELFAIVRRQESRRIHWQTHTPLRPRCAEYAGIVEHAFLRCFAPCVLFPATSSHATQQRPPPRLGQFRPWQRLHPSSDPTLAQAG